MELTFAPEINPARCPCQGCGWVLLDCDVWVVWVVCRLHGAGVPHPESEDEAHDGAAHLLAVQREAFAVIRDEARTAGFRGDFTKACQALIKGEATPQAWVDAAESLVVDQIALQELRAIFSAHRDAARAAGFQGDFIKVCQRDVRENTPQAWVDAAETLARSCAEARMVLAGT